MQASDPSQYEEILIESNDQSNSVDLRLGVQSIDYYEDIFSPTITAKIVVTTTGNAVNGKSIYNGLPLRGGERVSLKIKANTKTNPGLDFSDPTQYLYVSSITNVVSNNQVESFVLNLCSREAITNETARVPVKFPTSLPISSSVEKVIKDYIRTTKNVEVDKTMNKYGFIGNMRKPYSVIVWLAAKSVPDSKGTAGFVFYETKSGLKFKSLDKLITQEPKETYMATQVVNAPEVQDFQITKYAVDRNQHMLEKLRLGTYASQRMYWNPLDGKFTTQDKGLFKLGDYVDDAKNLGEKLTLPKVDENSEKDLGDIPTRMITGVIDVGTTEIGVSYDDKNADPFKYQSQALMRYNIMFTQSMTIEIPNNTNLEAGDLIECNFPVVTTNETKEFDTEQSGLYMIKELCHHYDTEGSWTTLKLIRDTFGKYGTNNKEN
jgi:hypothetical protein|tara:strand:+ start:234 stop:1535 length:1302 start_codon:yes stop_codon:yes gene_type:complete